MKFCPECGSVRNDKEICDCGYNYSTGEVEKKEEDKTNLFSGMNKIMEDIVPHQGAVPLEELKRRKLDTGDLLSVYYTTSGGMMGSYYNISLSFKECELDVVNQDWHHGERRQKVYKVDEEAAKEIKDLLIDNNFCAWSELPANFSMMAYDAPTSSMGLTFEQLHVSINSLVCMDKEENDLYLKVRDMVNSLVIDENLIKDFVLEEGTTFGLMSNNDCDSKLLTNKFCPDCGSKIPEGSYKCPCCGYRVPIDKND